MLSWSWNSNSLATWCEELTHWKRPWCWERLKAGEGDDRGWDGWMASLTCWHHQVWASSGSWWWTGKPDMLQSMGSQSQAWVSEWAEVFLAARAFSSCAEWGLLSGFSVQAPHCSGSCYCRTRTLGMRASVAHRLSCPMAHEIFLARDQTHGPCIGRQILNQWTTREVLFLFLICLSHQNIRSIKTGSLSILFTVVSSALNNGS